ncbi:MAG: flagellar biosynthesis protein FlhA [bacterium]|jgi:flagellar biosynthesis protein FlhA|nr:flagellar biosynthesis protein FlhA [bacterium]
MSAVASSLLGKRSDLLLAFGVVGILVMMVLPLPPIFLDLLLALNIMLALMILLVALYTLEPLDFSIFPGLLLILTLFRLSMNVASTRLILGQGYAGRVIEAFGHFVTGNNLVVGFIVFLVLVLINFIVITKGAGRVAEVAARFTLDAMPGKQMAIDAELNNGLIDEKEARRRRDQISREADFYGAMDGASKFVRGDAVAGLIITAINLVGGIAVGTVQLKLSLAESVSTFSQLTIGDGLVNQIPALIVSASAGIIVTRAGARSMFSRDMAQQLILQERPLKVAAVLLALFAVVPGLPALPFLLLAGGAGLLAARLSRDRRRQVVTQEVEQARPAEEKIEDFLVLDTLEIELGYGLIQLADPAQGGDLLARIKRLRKQVAADLGMVLPPVRIRDDISLAPELYRIRIRGIVAGEGELRPGWRLALGAPEREGGEELPGIPTIDPTFGMPALWVREAHLHLAERAGCALVDPAAVLATHLDVLVKRQAGRILSRQDVKKLLDNLKPEHAVLVEELVPGQLNLGQIHKVLQKLLREGVPIRDLSTILESLSDTADQSKDPEILAEYARFALASTISTILKGEYSRIKAVTLDTDLETTLARERDGTRPGSLSPEDFAQVIQQLRQARDRLQAEGRTPVVVTRPEIRSYLRRLLEGPLPDLMVVAYSELSMDVELESIVQVALPRRIRPAEGALREQPA